MFVSQFLILRFVHLVVLRFPCASQCSFWFVGNVNDLRALRLLRLLAFLFQFAVLLYFIFENAPCTLLTLFTLVSRFIFNHWITLITQTSLFIFSNSVHFTPNEPASETTTEPVLYTILKNIPQHSRLSGMFHNYQG